MTKRLKVVLLITLAAVCVLACALAGCKIGMPHGDELTKGYDVKITYYGNGGKFNGSSNFIPLELYVKNDPAEDNYQAAGVPFMDIRESGTSNTIKFDVAHVFGGWYEADTYPEGSAHAGEIKYTAEFDGEQVAVYPRYHDYGGIMTDSTDGRPVYAREGVDEMVLERNVRVVPGTKEVTSARRITADKPLVVCAVWKPALKVVYLLKTQNGTQYTDADGNKYGDGDRIGFSYFSGETLVPSEPCKFTDATYRGSFYDSNCNLPIEKLQKSEVTVEDPENPETFIYAQYIDGANWTFITNTLQSVRTLFNGLTNPDNNFYIEEDIDCSRFDGVNFNLKLGTMTSRAKIYGRGHTISNISFVLPATSANGAQYSLFGVLGKNFEVHDLTIKNISVKFNTFLPVSYYALWSGMEEGATTDGLQGLTVENITAEIRLVGDNGLIMNAQQDNRDRWLFGGVESDASFLAGISSDKLSIGGINTLTITKS